MSRNDCTAAAIAAQTMEQLEALTLAQLEITKVLAGIRTASQAGHHWLRLSNPQALAWEETKAWRGLLRRLAELGYLVRMETVMPVVGEDEERRRVELIIGWGARAKLHGMAEPLTLLPKRERLPAPE